jgi:hypothetical protein
MGGAVDRDGDFGCGIPCVRAIENFLAMYDVKSRTTAPFRSVVRSGRKTEIGSICR